MESRGVTEIPGGTESAGRNTPSFEKAKPVSEINPSYPPAAVRGRLEGKVLLEAQIDSSGKAVSVKVFSSSGHTLLDRAALKSVRQARFLPAVYLGKNVSDILTISVNFSLKE
jgi:protein TonB